MNASIAVSQDSPVPVIIQQKGSIIECVSISMKYNLFGEIPNLWLFVT